MKNLALFMIMIMAVLACSKEKDSLPLNDSVPVLYGKFYNNTEYNISIGLDSVTQDSRCPTGVECFWQGNATVRFIFTQDNNPIAFSLNTTAPFRKDTTIAGFKIELLSLKPWPVYLHPINQEDYIAEIKITR